MKKICIISLFGLLFAYHIFAQSDRVLLFQAEVANQSRQLLDGPDLYTVKFTIWDAQSGGTQLWEQQITGLVFQKGTISVLLGGAAAPFPSGLFTASDRYLQMTITKDAVSETLAPRMKITSSAYMIAGVETTGCPTGMEKVNNFCIDEARKGPLSEKDALLACYNRGARLCYWWQLYNACELGLLDINKGTPLSSELTAEACPQWGKGIWAYPGANASLPFCAKVDSPSVMWGNAVYLFYYRCCK
jgi:hypothetical protein